MCTNNRVHFGRMVVFLCLHIKLPHFQNYSDEYESIQLLKLLSSVCPSEFSQVSFTHYMGLCVIILPISIVIIVRILVFYYHQIGSMNHLPLSKVWSWKQWHALYVFLGSYISNKYNNFVESWVHSIRLALYISVDDNLVALDCSHLINHFTSHT